MSKPSNTTALSPKLGGDGRYSLGLSDTLVMRVTTSNSGDSTPLVSYLVEWGDDTSRKTDFKSIGGPVQFQHEYEDEGPYLVTVTTTNLSEEKLVESFSLLVTRRETTVTPVNTWRGIATPGIGLSDSNSARVYPPFSARLSGPASVDATVIYLAPDPSSSDRVQEGDELVITEINKLLSYVVVSSVDNGAITLFGSLNDSYTTAAIVEVRHTTTQRRIGDTTVRTGEWFFPVAYGREMVKASLRTLLYTRVGERVMRPDVGNNLHKIPFEQNDVFTRDQSGIEVSKVFAQEPRAVLENVTIVSDNNDITVKVAASVINEQSEFELEVGV